ncbi:hypothetical protein [Pseudotamlana agarivorans]|uniref:hypothetical protein n=1 Tax=Pseudotamlana agarivorans TaxID=481183 RepID=UPI000A3E44C7|nr:hypothetical protein [Tamlana agarivorans]
MYFNNITTLEEAKDLFKSLCKELHPDTSGYDSQADFVAMHSEFKTITNELKFKTNFEADKDFDADKFYNALKQFDVLRDIQISFVGCFIWLEDLKAGAMYQQKELIKAIKVEGYNTARWANKKKMWYFSSEGYSQKFKSNKTLDQIKQTYGSNEFKTKQTYSIA